MAVFLIAFICPLVSYKFENAHETRPEYAPKKRQAEEKTGARFVFLFVISHLHGQCSVITFIFVKIYAKFEVQASRSKKSKSEL